MDDQKALQLQKETGCDIVLGKLLLKFTGGDVEGAARIIKAVEKDIFVIRGKFIAQTSKLYGTFIFFYDTRKKSVEKLNVVIKEEDKSAIEFDFEKQWHQFYDLLIDYSHKNATDFDKQKNFDLKVKDPKSLSIFEKIFLKKDNIDENQLKLYLTEILLNITGDFNIAIKIKIDKTDAFELNKGNIKESDIDFDKNINHNNEEKKETNKKIEQDNNPILMIKIEPELAPVDGIEISELQPGELIGVRIIDDRPIVNYIYSLLKGPDINSRENTTVFAELKDIKVLDNGGIVLKVEFGPGIYGEAYYAENVKVRVARKDDFNKNKEEQKNNFFMKYFWIIGGALIIIIIILLILLIQQ